MAEEALFNTPFDELPDPRRVWVSPPGSEAEGLGKLSILTPEVIAQTATSEIQSGQRVTLNWDLTKLETAGFNRQPCQHHIISLLNGLAFDDVYIFNPQQSSQWDGLRHFSQQATGGKVNASKERLYYGGTTAAEILDRNNTRIGIHYWAREGIVGRGVLIDYASYAEKNNIKYSTFSLHEVTLKDILTIANECNITFKRGDILFIRIGVTKEWDTVMTDAQKRAYAQSTSPQHAGVEATLDVLRWLWNCGFAAVAGDAISWEVYPPKNPDMFLHEYLLAGWGMPVGEMFDLERLSQMCKVHNRWSFFLASVPLNMPGGVSSPPNAVAIF